MLLKLPSPRRPLFYLPYSERAFACLLACLTSKINKQQGIKKAVCDIGLRLVSQTKMGTWR